MNSIEQFFKDNLDGKLARVHSEGLWLEGGMEQNVLLEYSKFFGLRCLVKLEHNNIKLDSKIKDVLFDNRQKLDMSYDLTNKLYALLNSMIESTRIQGGIITCYNVKSFNVEYRDKDINSVSITYTNGSTTKIFAIQAPKTK